MKKLVILIVSILIGCNFCFANYLDKQLKSSKKTKYNSVKIHNQNNNINNITDDIKDPKLIKLADYNRISDSDYNKKLKDDEEEYKKQKAELKTKKESTSKNQPLGVDLYNLYRIVEKIIRANNLGYINWRITLINDTKAFNAYATSANLIAIYSALYDSLYGNDDALAFVISHELSHQILGHAQRTADLDKTLRRWVPEGERGTLDLIYFKKMREMELEADSQAFELLAKAGYSSEKAMDAISFMETLPDYSSLYSSHPKSKERRKNALEIARYNNPEWAEIGKANIYKSNVLEAKRSSDKVSFVIVGNGKENSFETESYEQRLLRYAYLSYLNKDFNNAIKYFEKLVKEEEKFEYYLYLSYANEALYNKTKKEKYLLKAVEDVNLAKNLSSNKYVLEQIEALKSL